MSCLIPKFTESVPNGVTSLMSPMASRDFGPKERPISYYTQQTHPDPRKSKNWSLKAAQAERQL